MKSNKDIIKLTEKHVFGNYGRFPIALVKGKGARVWDKAGKVYLDFLSGVAVNSLGHCHPKVVAAIRRQAGRLIHVSNHYHIEEQSRLAAELTRLSFADKVFFCNSGTEANEAAIKLARRYFYDKGQKDRNVIITAKNSFHGRTMGAVSATGQKEFHEGFAPMLKGFKIIPFDNAGAAKKAVNAKTCAIMVEPVQGETGVNIPSKTYLKELRTLCDEHKILLILDEVQTGCGRTGTLFAYEPSGIKPDIMTLAKALGGGFPIGALLATDRVAKSFVPGTHGSTFGGNPLACATALIVLKELSRKSFLKDVKAKGEYFKSRLLDLAGKFKVIREVRGVGMILAIDLKKPSMDVVLDCMEQGVLINAIKPKTLRFIPPLTVTRKDIDQVMRALANSLEKL